MARRLWKRIQRRSTGHVPPINEIKPLLRGWLHAFAAGGALIATIGMLIATYHDPARFIALLIFGLSMIVLFAVSSVYHIGSWQGRTRTILRAFDHANIFLLIAGTYTPICVIVLQGPLRTIVLAVIWILALAGVGSSVLTLRIPRWALAGLYLGMGWIALVPTPSLVNALPLTPIALFAAGGIAYTIGAVIYAFRRPNPWPRFIGFHEIFHAFTIIGSLAFLIAIWGWVVPFVRG